MPEEKNEQFPETDSEILFTQLVLSFQAAAWQQMGKVPSIFSGKIERSLEMAKHSIDMLGMLEQKTKGNLTESENKYLSHTLFELRMNYLEEARKGPDKRTDEGPPSSPENAPPPSDKIGPSESVDGQQEKPRDG
jgi:hypothetical protein